MLVSLEIIYNHFTDTDQTMVVQKVDNTIHWINVYHVHTTVHCVLDSNFSIGQGYPFFEQLAPAVHRSTDISHWT